MQTGHYQNGLVVQMLAQCWINFKGVINVPGFVDGGDFPYAAVVLSTTSVGLSPYV